jgi:hypothetical protein
MLSITAFNINIIMGFHKTLKESLNTTNLKRIRIKTDPLKVANNKDFKNVEGYEGFILSESMGRFKILVLAPDMPIMDIPPEMLEHMHQEHDVDVLTSLKNHCKEFLMKSKNKKQDDPVFANIDNSNCLGDVETFLKQNGVTTEELNGLYRGFIENE